MPLENIRLKTSVAYPVVEVPLRWAVAALLIWDKITIIWDPGDTEHLRDYAVRTPVFIDNGFVDLAKPSEADVDRASMRLAAHLKDPGTLPPSDGEFATAFALHPVKVTGAYWDSVRRSADGFVLVPAKFGAAYVGLLAEEMAGHAGISTVCMRYDEPLFLAGATPERADATTAEDCVARASFEVLGVELKGRTLSAESDLAKEVCKDITALRNLDGWYTWRELICKYLDALAGMGSHSQAVATIAAEMRSGIRKYEKEVLRQRWATLAKIGVTAAGGAVGFFVGSIPSAIAGAATGGAMLGVDLFQGRAQQEERRSGWQHFILEARKRFS